MPPSDSLLEFPCLFPLKVMGLTGPDFDILVVEIVRRHVPDLDDDAVRAKPSREGKYTALTITLKAHSKAQLDALYMELCAHQRILMVL